MEWSSGTWRYLSAVAAGVVGLAFLIIAAVQQSSLQKCLKDISDPALQGQRPTGWQDVYFNSLIFLPFLFLAAFARLMKWGLDRVVTRESSSNSLAEALRSRVRTFIADSVTGFQNAAFVTLSTWLLCFALIIPGASAQRLVWAVFFGLLPLFVVRAHLSSILSHAIELAYAERLASSTQPPSTRRAAEAVPDGQSGAKRSSRDSAATSTPFLARPAYDWADERATQLRDILLACYPSPEDAEHLAKVSGVSIDRVRRDATMLILWNALLEESARQGKLHALVVRASMDPHIAAYHGRLARLSKHDSDASTLSLLDQSEVGQARRSQETTTGLRISSDNRPEVSNSKRDGAIGAQTHLRGADESENVSADAEVEEGDVSERHEKKGA